MFHWSVISENWTLIFNGLAQTLYYTVVTTVLGLLIGTLICLMRISRSRPLSLLGLGFVEFFRNVPLLVWLLWSYYALPIFAGIDIDKQTSGIVALSFYAASYYAEILRAGIQSLPSGQVDAARALGMSEVQALKRIILPQAFRNMVPPLAGQTVIQMKNTTLLSVITIHDLLYQASYIASFTYRPMEVYTAIGIIFLAILIPCNWLARRLEMRTQ